jgi:hypothetical protein
VFDSVLAKQENGIVEFVPLKYFHPEHPENHTVRMVRLTQDTEAGIVEVWNGKRWIQKEAEDLIDGMMLDIEGNLMVAVEEGILGDDVDEKVAKRRRKILNGAMLKMGWMQIQFTDIVPEGTYRWEMARGEFVSEATVANMQQEDREKRLCFYRDLEKAMQKFQQVHRQIPMAQ